MIPTPASKRKIALLKQGEFSHINQNIELILRKHFPNHHLDVVDIGELLHRHHRSLAINIPYFIKEYGISFQETLSQHRKNFYRTSYLFYQAKKIVAETLQSEYYDFTFQTQSLFDLSMPGIPHFLYTDHAILSNLVYPDISRDDISAQYPAAVLALEKTIYQNATINFTMGNFVAQTLVEEYGCNPNSVVYAGGGSNLPQKNVNALTDQRLPAYDSKNILFVGVVWERKGGVELIAAFEKIRLKHPSATLTIVGCCPAINVPGCKVIGRVSLDEIHAYYEHASIYCMPSHREPFGIAYIEAFMNKLPVVATRVGAIPDIVQHGESGLLVEPKDHSGLCNAVDQLLSDPALCRSYGEKGYHHVIQHFTWDAVGNTLAEHIKAILLNEYDHIPVRTS